MNEAINKENGYVGYEYKDVTVKRSMESVFVDGYSNFGWSIEDSSIPIGKVDSVILKFKRDRKIRNKAELTRLQRQFDTCVTEILSLESSKYIKASAVAYIVGVVGTAFMAGSVFAVTGGNSVLTVILAIPGFVGWIIPYLLYSKISRTKTEQVNPLIDQKYDEIYDICEKANSLISYLY